MNLCSNCIAFWDFIFVLILQELMSQVMFSPFLVQVWDHPPSCEDSSTCGWEIWAHSSFVQYIVWPCYRFNRERIPKGSWCKFWAFRFGNKVSNFLLAMEYKSWERHYSQFFIPPVRIVILITWIKIKIQRYNNYLFFLEKKKKKKWLAGLIKFPTSAFMIHWFL